MKDKKRGEGASKSEVRRGRRGRDELENDATKQVLEKGEAFERHVKTVTTQAESLATTEVDFFQTLLKRHEESQDHLNALKAQLRTVSSILF